MTDPRSIRPVSLDDASSFSPTPHGGQEPALVFLRAPKPKEPKQLSRLARLLGLEPYSSVLLTKRVRVELEILALVLVGVFFFEYLAWSFFFNGLFAGDVLTLGWSSLAALIVAFPFAATILYFERQVITTDTYRLTMRQRLVAQGIRLLAIAAAAFIVAHPVELIAFRIPVEELLYQEAVADKESVLEKNLTELSKTSIGARREELRNELQRVRDDIKVARRTRDQADADSDNYRRQRELVGPELSEAQKALAVVESRISRLRAEDAEVPPPLQRERDRWLDRIERTGQQLRDLSGRSVGQATLAENIDEQIEQLELEEEQLQTIQGELREEALHFENQLRAFKTHANLRIADLRSVGPKGDPRPATIKGGGESWPEEWNELLKFQRPEVTFFQKLDALYAAVRKRIESEGILNPYLLVFLGIHLAAVFIPSLIFVTKWWLIPENVNIYYSARHQAQAGDPEAQLMLSVDEQVRQPPLVEEEES